MVLRSFETMHIETLDIASLYKLADSRAHGVAACVSGRSVVYIVDTYLDCGDLPMNA